MHVASVTTLLAAVGDTGAMSCPPAETILIAPGSYRLSSTLHLARDLNIIGVVGSVILTNASSPIRLLSIAANVAVVLRGVILSGGYHKVNGGECGVPEDAMGGGVLVGNGARLTMEDCAVTHCTVEGQVTYYATFGACPERLQTQSSAYGGGVYVGPGAELSLRRVSVTNNNADSYRGVAWGGGIFFALGSNGTINDCVIAYNSVNAGKVSRDMANSTLPFLRSMGIEAGGGGVATHGFGTRVNMDACYVRGNRVAGSNSVLEQPASMSNGLRSGTTNNWIPMSGGGIMVEQASALVMSQSVIADNVARTGGGMSVRYKARVHLLHNVFTGNDQDGPHSLTARTRSHSCTLAVESNAFEPYGEGAPTSKAAVGAPSHSIFENNTFDAAGCRGVMTITIFTPVIFRCAQLAGQRTADAHALFAPLQTAADRTN
jgi:hypothetical protein